MWSNLPYKTLDSHAVHIVPVKFLTKLNWLKILLRFQHSNFEGLGIKFSYGWLGSMRTKHPNKQIFNWSKICPIPCECGLSK